MLNKKYIIQPKWYDCGPTAIFNAMVFHNKRVNKTIYKQLMVRTKCDRLVGCYVKDLDRVIRKEFKNSIYDDRPTLNKIRKNLKQGRCILISQLCSGKRERHLYLITKELRCGNFFYVVNRWSDKTGEYSPRQLLVKRLKTSYVWYI